MADTQAVASDSTSDWVLLQRGKPIHASSRPQLQVCSMVECVFDVLQQQCCQALGRRPPSDQCTSHIAESSESSSGSPRENCWKLHAHELPKNPGSSIRADGNRRIEVMTPWSAETMSQAVARIIAARVGLMPGAVCVDIV